MNKKELKALSFLIDDSQLSRSGSYGLDTEIFLIALKEYIKTGINRLTEYDSLIYLNWNYDWNKEEIILFEKAMCGETFWNIFSIYDDKDIDLLKEKYRERKDYLEMLDTYKSRRKRLFTKSLKDRIKKRDNFTCKKCKCKKESNKLVVHHIFKLIDGGNNEESNLTTLCVPCHKLIHTRKK